LSNFFRQIEAALLLTASRSTKMALKRPLKQTPNAPGATVTGLDVYTVELTHAFGQISTRGLYPVLPADTLAKAMIDEACQEK